MEPNQGFEELIQNLDEIEKQNRLVRLRNMLKFLLVGFLIGRKSERRISNLIARNKKIIDALIAGFEDNEILEPNIREFSDRYIQLGQFKRRIVDVSKQLASSKELLLSTEDGISNYRELIVACLRRTIEKKEEIIGRHVRGIGNSGTYLIHSDKQELFNSIGELKEDLDCCYQNEVLDKQHLDQEIRKLEEYRSEILGYNKAFVEERKKKYDYLWRKGLLSLDDEQQTAIVTDDKHNLVVAAAGSGKTEVLITRIAYLKARKPDTVNPNRILAIAYQNKDVKQIEDRLKNQYGINGVGVRTFHKLGISVLKRAWGRKPDILDDNERKKMIKSIYQHEIEQKSDGYQAFLMYVKSLHDTEVNGDTADQIDTIKMRRTLPYNSIDDTKVESRAEKEILDFLLTSKLNGELIQVTYAPQIKGLGKPDFYIPKYDLFIEHWGLNREGKVPDWFSQTTEEYKENMERKKQWFASNNKLLVETFSYEYDKEHPEDFLQLFKDRILEKLNARSDAEFRFTTMDYRELVEAVCISDRDWITEDRVAKDIFDFIKNAKTYNLEPERILQKLEDGKYSRKQCAFGRLAVKVYVTFKDRLVGLGKIDFEDMINTATDALKSNHELCKDMYDHILIDEYQDISEQSFKLIKELMTQNPKCKLFCVGDDWQSIMGFAGSNLEFFVNFGNYFDHPEITNISTNYRSIKTIVDAGSCLIKHNHSCQLQKDTVSRLKKEELIKVIISPHTRDYEMNYYRDVAENCLDRVTEYLERGYRPEDILILIRIMHITTRQVPKMHDIVENIHAGARQRRIDISRNPKTTKNVRLLSVHKAKGLEAKVVFILNAINDKYGFPCDIEDPSILEPAKENYPIQDRKEEERRLFYVAMTRAMDDLFIYTWKPATSEFLEEIRDYTIEERLDY